MPLTVDQRVGYAERDLDADLARRFPDGPRTERPKPARPVEPFLAGLPHDVEADFRALGRPGVLEPGIGLLALLT
ncbi:hypothetical protein [Streptomyces sp. S.PB5]|uniref:hypothetical protein n=1 Tax=Streptomyces sp. S.PB5 TaxID=3020844 RepID=UPI0025B15A41|nr:hypothetical protein [Streptomyces sp. S.PB5]MDN3025276.1 hypothetical protein [Streptomyces sp. S.PB5]